MSSVAPYDVGVGKLLRDLIDGSELLAEWDPSDPTSIDGAEREYRRWLDQGYVAVRSDDGAHFKPVKGERLPVDAQQVVLAVAKGGG